MKKKIFILSILIAINLTIKSQHTMWLPIISRIPNSLLYPKKDKQKPITPLVYKSRPLDARMFDYDPNTGKITYNSFKEQLLNHSEIKP